MKLNLMTLGCASVKQVKPVGIAGARRSCATTGGIAGMVIGICSSSPVYDRSSKRRIGLSQLYSPALGLGQRRCPTEHPSIVVIRSAVGSPERFGKSWNMAYSTRSYMKHRFLYPLRSTFHSHRSNSRCGYYNHCTSRHFGNHCNSNSTKNYNTCCMSNLSPHWYNRCVTVHTHNCNPSNCHRRWYNWRHNNSNWNMCCIVNLLLCRRHCAVAHTQGWCSRRCMRRHWWYSYCLSGKCRCS